MCKQCGAETTNPKFCQLACSVTYNNSRRKSKKSDLICKNCKISLRGICGSKYCSQKCHKRYNKSKTYEKLEKGQPVNSKAAKSALIWKHGNRCMECGWDKINQHTGNVPIELEHVDGNYKNNKLENLKLLCPNCHSLTPTYKGANKGSGREYRRKGELV